jgi:hypothetical protein
LRQFVVGQNIGAALGLAQMGKPEHRDALDLEELGGLDPAVTGDDLAVVADQHRICEAKPFNAVGDLLDLLFGWVRALRL